MNIAGVEEAETTIKIENFSAKLHDINIFFQTVYLDNSYFIWVGNEEAKFNDLILSLKSSTVNIYLYYKSIQLMTNNVGSKLFGK